MDPILSKKNKKTKRGRETLFRTTYQNQSNLIQVADNKANIIISINTMIISSIIAITGYGVVAGEIDTYEAPYIIPVILILMTCLLSVIFAILAARPKLILPKTEGDHKEKSSLLFFGEIASYSQEVYLEKMKRLIEVEDELYEHMMIDLYNQGHILKRKYYLLSYTYKIFMFGFIFSVTIFTGFLIF